MPPSLPPEASLPPRYAARGKDAATLPPSCAARGSFAATLCRQRHLCRWRQRGCLFAARGKDAASFAARASGGKASFVCTVYLFFCGRSGPRLSADLMLLTPVCRQYVLLNIRCVTVMGSGFRHEDAYAGCKDPDTNPLCIYWVCIRYAQCHTLWHAPGSGS